MKPMRVALCLAGVCALTVAGCTSRGSSLLERLAPLAKESILGPEEVAPAEGPPLTRAVLNQIPFATIAVSSEATKGGRAVIVPVANNGGYLTYQDVTGSSFVLFGGLITATHGLPKNLSAVKHAADDPVVVPTPVSQWPSTVKRNYQYARINAKDFEISVVCKVSPVAREQIEIFEIFFNVTRIEETCTNPRRTFRNTYWAEPDTGFIWKSVQWIGPQTEPLTVEVIRPFEG